MNTTSTINTYATITLFGGDIGRRVRDEYTINRTGFALVTTITEPFKEEEHTCHYPCTLFGQVGDTTLHNLISKVCDAGNEVHARVITLSRRPILSAWEQDELGRRTSDLEQFKSAMSFLTQEWDNRLVITRKIQKASLRVAGRIKAKDLKRIFK